MNSKTQTYKYKGKEYEGQLEYSELSNVGQNPSWLMKRDEIKDRNKIGRNDNCYCFSEKKYKRCCWNKPPILHLINMVGRDNVLLDDDGDLVVGIGKELCIEEGSSSERIFYDGFDLDLRKVKISDIVDYNSLWEITKTGWDTPNYSDGIIYPYICVGSKWWRWDNSLYIRDWCNTFVWTKKEHQKWSMVYEEYQKYDPICVVYRNKEVV
tara:strand:- start:102 stop:731 length:630 start_codon:yes stop_codon:yes gene_type:complete